MLPQAFVSLSFLLKVLHMAIHNTSLSGNPNSVKTTRETLHKTGTKKARGFTLVELLITVVVLGIISAIAIPSYRNYIIHSRRSDAVKALIESQQIMENCRTNSTSRTYAGCDAVVSSGVSPAFYDIAVTVSDVAISATTTVSDVAFTITATPKAGTSQADDTKCTSFSLQHNGEQNASNDDCWQ
jgi:type IV pilus assembly protein PilE